MFDVIRRFDLIWFLPNYIRHINIDYILGSKLSILPDEILSKTGELHQILYYFYFFCRPFLCKAQSETSKPAYLKNFVKKNTICVLELQLKAKFFVFREGRNNSKSESQLSWNSLCYFVSCLTKCTFSTVP